MAAPTFVIEAEGSAWIGVGTKTTGSFSVQTGDILVCLASDEDRASENLNAPTNTGTAFTWNQEKLNATNSYPALGIWTATATASQSMTVSIATSGTGNVYSGLDVLVFRNSAGVGASSLTNVTGGAPTMNITTTQANSAIAVISADWAAVDGTSRTWRANAGALTETAYATASGRYTIYAGYHADAGAINTYAVGLSAPGAQTYVIAAVEIKGTGAAITQPIQKRGVGIPGMNSTAIGGPLS